VKALALTVLYLALTVLYLALTVLYLALTVLYLALTVLPLTQVKAHVEASREGRKEALGKLEAAGLPRCPPRTLQ